MMTECPYPKGKCRVKWVTTEWLQDHLDDKKMMIVDIQPNIHDYIQEHIPGAVYMEEGFLRSYFKRRPGVWAPPEQIESAFGRLGIKPQLPVVVYTGEGQVKHWGDGLEQCMAAYSLVRYGHDNVLILDGGIDKWRNEKREVTKVFPERSETEFLAEVRDEYFMGYQELKEIKDNDDVVLLDARPAATYEGQGPWSKPGHIPGAMGFPWRKLMTDENPRQLKPENVLLDMIEKAGITKDKLIICSCGTGREATNEFNLFKFYLQYPRVKLHEGGFLEWTSYPENPTVIGKDPR
jgi:thiosulfate/3-mercaptopyruvate sulfurtransferase